MYRKQLSKRKVFLNAIQDFDGISASHMRARARNEITSIFRHFEASCSPLQHTMSRHRTAYTDEDLYDDYDDYYEEEEDVESFAEQHSKPSTTTSSYFDIAQPIASVGHNAYISSPSLKRDEQIKFILDMLGSESIVTAARVGQMLDLFDGDTEKTVAHFLEQKSIVSSPAQASDNSWPVKKKVTIESIGAGKGAPKVLADNKDTKSMPKSLGSGSVKKETHSVVRSNKEVTSMSKMQSSGVNKLDEDKLAYNAEKLAIRLTEQEKEEMQSFQDINFMGFGEEAAKIEVKRGSVWTITKEEAESRRAEERSTLLTDNAVLSDDDFKESSASKGNLGSDKEDRAHLTMIVAGHVDAGKSTLVGHLLYKAGQVAQRTIHKYQKESTEQGKGSFALAWVMDESAAERAHGVTIDIAERKLNTRTKIITILDSPGHRDFIPNMISGATFADAALLVIPASVGEYESCMGSRAQTREHAVLLRALGVSQIIVVVNKMDMTQPAWSQSRFETIKSEITALLVELQFRVDQNVRFVPTAGLSGENLFDVSSTNQALKTWYSGQSLLESIDTFRNPLRFVNRPLRAIVTAVVSQKDKTCTVRVNVQQGRMRCGRGVGLTTSHGSATIKSIVDDDGMNLQELCAGYAGTAVLQDRTGRTGAEMALSNGMILCKGPPLARLTRKFRATLLTMANIVPPIMPGSTFELYLHGEEVQCKIDQILSLAVTDPSTGVTTMKARPKCIPGSRSAVVIIETTERKVCIENFRDCKGLGRFALRSTGGTAAVGVCDAVVDDVV